MKRHPSLVPLSRFHRKMLFFALIARHNAPDIQGYPRTIEGKIKYSLEFYKDELTSHFSTEEKLWEYFGEKYPAIRPLISELRSERIKIHELFNRLKEENTRKCLEEIGPKLEKHVRREERQLFETIQDVASAEDLTWVDNLIETM